MANEGEEERNIPATDISDLTGLDIHSLFQTAQNCQIFAEVVTNLQRNEDGALRRVALRRLTICEEEAELPKVSIAKNFTFSDSISTIISIIFVHSLFNCII